MFLQQSFELIDKIKENLYITNYLNSFEDKIYNDFKVKLNFDHEFIKKIINNLNLKMGYPCSWSLLWINYCNENINIERFNNYCNDFDEKDKEYIYLFLIRYLYCVPFVFYLVKSYDAKILNSYLLSEHELKEQNNYNINKKTPDYKCAGNMDITAYYYEHGIPTLPNRIKEYIKYKDFFDIGGYTGDSIPVLNKFLPSRIYSFEPDLSLFNKLNKTIEMNALKNRVKAVNKALSNKNGIVKFSFYGNMVRNSQFVNNLIDFPTIRLDDFVFNKGCRPGLLKLDVEGSEYSIIVEGSKRLIEKYKPVLLISIYHNPRDFFEIKENLKKWNLDYIFKVEQHNCFKPNAETILKCYPKLNND